jgi:iron only hydrogenase large subunit-like protein
MKEVMDFVLTREEVVKITKDNKDTFAKKPDSEDDEL